MFSNYNSQMPMKLQQMQGFQPGQFSNSQFSVNRSDYSNRNNNQGSLQQQKSPIQIALESAKQEKQMSTVNSKNQTLQTSLKKQPSLSQQSQISTPQYKNKSQYSIKKGDSNTYRENFQVAIRVRPPLPREIQGEHFISTTQISPDNKSVCIYEYNNIDLVELEDLEEFMQNPNNYNQHQFNFDMVYNQESSQQTVYENTARQAVISVLEGFNATIMAYGQTGAGKTHTMEGFRYTPKDPDRGIIPRATEEIFNYIENCKSSNKTFMVRASYLQIYNEVISDLLRNERTALQIREDKKHRQFVEGLSEWAVRTPNEIYKLMQKGALCRATAETALNDISSRSHAIFQIIVEHMTIDENGEKRICVGKLNLVDLAGSERVRVTKATGQRLEECKKINSSLSALGNVIAALIDKNQRFHIPYRNSKLTRILENSLGGNCKTTFIACISPSISAFFESLSSLKFANRAKNIQNAPKINQDFDQKALLSKYQLELQKLRQELAEKNKGLIDKTRLLQLEREKQKAEQDKEVIMQILEQKTQEFLLERDQKKLLEEKISQMNSQMLVGGQKIEETQQFKSALAQQQKILRQEYEKKLFELENELQNIEEDKQQVDKYKQLLLKQRDIMIALTTRLNERDETIIQLQEELDAFDRIHHETEQHLQISKEKNVQFKQILQQNNISIPVQLLTDEDAFENKEILEDIQQNNPEMIYGSNGHSNNNNNIQENPYYQELLQINEQQEQRIAELQNQMNNLNEIGNQGHSYNSENLQEKYEKMLNNVYDKSNQEKLQLLNQIEQLKSSQNQLLEKLQMKENMQQQPQDYQFIFEEIKASVDSIIETLSKPNDQYKLQNVAKDLLNLQKILGQEFEDNIIPTSKDNGHSNNLNGNNKSKFLPSQIKKDNFAERMSFGIQQNTKYQFQ